MRNYTLMSLVAALAFASLDAMSHGAAPTPAAQERSGHGSVIIAHGSRTGGAPLKAIDERASALPGRFAPPPDLAAVAKSDFARIIDQLIAKSSEIRRLKKRKESAPNSSWLGDTKSSIQKELNAAFESVQGILFEKILYDYVGQFEKQKENPGHLKNEIDTYEQNISTIVQSIKSRFITMGIDLSDSQITILLKRIDSRNILMSTDLFNVNDQLMRLLIDSMRMNINGFDINSIYYGIHLILLETIIHNEQNDISRIRQAYMPRIQKAIAHAVEEIGIINQLLDKAPGEPQKHELNESLRANLLTRKVAISYANLLKDRATRIASARIRAVETLQVANSILASTNTSADLILHIDQSRQKLSLLAIVQAPVIEPFESEQEADVFANLTARLREMN